MQVALLLWCLASTMCGAAGFMCAGVRHGRCAARNGGSGSGRGVRRTMPVPAACQAYDGRFRAVAATVATSRVGVSAAGSLRMDAAEGQRVSDDGGSSDGTTLAEARIVVQGQATGGYFRAHARNEAHFNRKLCGALKELGQGKTEIIVEGKTSAIRSFLRWCKKGPGLSQQIQEVTVDWSDYTGIFDGFEVFPDEASQNKAAGVP